MSKILGFYHVCLLNHWKKIVGEQIELIEASGLYSKTDRIFIGCVGSQDEKVILEKLLPEKYQIVYHNTNVKLAEMPTLQCLQDTAQDNDFLVWYIHTKGVVSERNQSYVLRWRKIMEYFIIEKHEDCIKTMVNCDACGIDLRLLGVNHFDDTMLYFFGWFWAYIGNFWWSKAAYIRKLPNLTQFWLRNNKSRYVAETFIGLSPTAKLCSLYNEKIDDPKHQPNYRHIMPAINFPAKKIKLI